MYQNKVVYSFIVAVCLLCSFAACSNGDPYVPLTETEMHQISRDWEIFNNTPLAWQYQDLDHYALFYGRYNGSIVLLISGEHIEIMPIFKHDIAGYTFEYSKPFALYAYCEGVFTPLEEAYDNGVITQTHISQICEYHKTKRFDYGDYYENKERL